MLASRPPLDGVRAAATPGGDIAPTAAKYVQGKVGMVRSPRNLATRALRGQRDGMIVLRLDDGGSLAFYKEISTPGLNIGRATFKRRASDDEFAIASDQSIFTRGLLNKSLRESVRRLDTDSATRKRIDRVQVSARAEDFVAPLEMPYLSIPASVPWQFRSKSGKGHMPHHTFQIVVPPSAEGGPDRRVKVMTPREKAKHTRLVTTTSRGAAVTFASLIRGDDDGSDDNDDSDDNDGSGDDDDTASSVLSFTFWCENPHDLAVYAEAAAALGRAHGGNKYSGKGSRVRSAEGMEVAAQTALLRRSRNGDGALSRRLDSIGREEFRVLPLHAYPNTWMTKQEIAEDLPRQSFHFHDLRKGSQEEIGCIRIELLQCMGLKKMDRYSLSDVYAYIVCGSAAFISDVIPNNLNPAWLPKSRRACTMPLRDAYAQVFVGLFDYDGEKEKDDFGGRVVIDVPRLQSGFVYDVTLPLRETSRVYTRKRLGCVRLRLQVSWTRGERSALLSYLPKSLADITKRLKKERPDPETRVCCPDAKSFQNVCRTVYGEDIPGKFNASLATAVSRELTLMNKMVEFNTKRILRDIHRWNNPLLSSYIFTGWMYFVRQNSFRLLPSFILSLFLIFMIRNHVKYNLQSVAGYLYGRRSIGSMCHILLFNKYDNTVPSQIQSTSFGAVEWLASKVFGIARGSLGKDSWKEEDNSEYPFSVGSYHPKVSSDEAAAAHLWDAAQDISLSSPAKKSFALDIDDDEWNSDEEEEGLLHTCNEKVKKGISNTKHAISPRAGHTSFTSSRKRSLPIASENNSILMEESLQNREGGGNFQTPKTSSLGGSNFHMHQGSSVGDSNFQMPASSLGGSIFQMPNNSRAAIVTPDQNVNTKAAKKNTSMLEDIDKIHKKVSRVNLHLFDDRVFLAEDTEACQKLLSMYPTNPIRRRMNPLCGGVMKIFDIQISIFRAIFNLCMWKDPMLSFWFSLLVFCLMIVLAVFPWRFFFFLIGVIGLGPQNYFLVKFNCAKRPPRSKRNPVKGGSGQAKRVQRSKTNQVKGSGQEYWMNTCLENVSKSPLLFRDNIQMKPDAKRREVIIPGGDCVFRLNRFYDWPPDPATSTVQKGAEFPNVEEAMSISPLQNH